MRSDDRPIHPDSAWVQRVPRVLGKKGNK